MVSCPESSTMGICSLTRTRWTCFPAILPRDEAWIRQRKLSLCCDGIPEESMIVGEARRQDLVSDSILIISASAHIELDFAHND
jgi:hypothetical protein